MTEVSGKLRCLSTIFFRTCRQQLQRYTLGLERFTGGGLGLLQWRDRAVRIMHRVASHLQNTPLAVRNPRHFDLTLQPEQSVAAHVRGTEVQVVQDPDAQCVKIIAGTRARQVWVQMEPGHEKG